MPAEPAELLASVAALRRRTRTARHAYWAPLLLFGVLLVLAAPLYAESVDPAPIRATRHNPALTGLGGTYLEHSATLGWYWLAALIGGYLLSLTWYRWHGRRVGVHTPTRGYRLAGLAGIAVGLLLPLALRFLLNAATPVVHATSWVSAPLLRACNLGMSAHLVIAVGLAVLARLERSPALAAVAATFTTMIVLVNVYFATADLQPEDVGRYGYLLGALLPAPVLLLGGAAALARARRRTT